MEWEQGIKAPRSNVESAFVLMLSQSLDSKFCRSLSVAIPKAMFFLLMSPPTPLEVRVKDNGEARVVVDFVGVKAPLKRCCCCCCCCWLSVGKDVVLGRLVG